MFGVCVWMVLWVFFSWMDSKSEVEHPCCFYSTLNCRDRSATMYLFQCKLAPNFCIRNDRLLSFCENLDVRNFLNQIPLLQCQQDRYCRIKYQGPPFCPPLWLCRGISVVPTLSEQVLSLTTLIYYTPFHQLSFSNFS